MILITPPFPKKFKGSCPDCSWKHASQVYADPDRHTTQRYRRRTDGETDRQHYVGIHNIFVNMMPRADHNACSTIG